MRKVKNITVCVSPEIYRQTRHLAAQYDSTVSTIVAWLLERLPAALERSRFPKGGPKPSAAVPSSLVPMVTAPPTPSPPPRHPPPPPPLSHTHARTSRLCNCTVPSNPRSFNSLQPLT